LIQQGGEYYVGALDDHHEPSGIGSLFDSEGEELYKGHWLKGQKHGPGAEWWPVGDLFEGEYRHGRRYHGTMVWKSGATYGGAWRNNLMHGLGCYTLIDSSIWEGEWMNDSFEGLGVRWDANGKMIACGRFEQDQFVEALPVPTAKLPVGKYLTLEGECGLLPLNAIP
jgi:hypothetical protein